MTALVVSVILKSTNMTGVLEAGTAENVSDRRGRQGRALLGTT